MVVDVAPVNEPKEVGKGIFRAEINSSREGMGEILSSMPDFGYMAWTKDGQPMTDEIIKKKIANGARVVVTMSGLDSDPRQFEEIAKQIHEEYKGEQELIVTGVACPGFWKQQYKTHDRKLSVGDVSTDQYVLMTLEWAKLMGLSEENAILIGHSAGGEAATKLSKWFKVMALSASLHLGLDFTFLGIVGANAVAEKGISLGLGGAVGPLQEATIAVLSGAGEYKDQMQVHFEGAGAMGGESHSKKTWELCLGDEIPAWNINTDNILIMGGDKDILTSFKKKKAWFLEWFKRSNPNDNPNDVWEKIAGWFPKDIQRILKHDSVLLNPDARRIVSTKAAEWIVRLDGVAAVVSAEDLLDIRKNVAGQSGDESKLQVKISGGKSIYELIIDNINKDIEIYDYIEPEIWNSINGFLKLRPDDQNFEPEWRKMVVNLLSNSEEFSEDELVAIGSGEMKLSDLKVRDRITFWPRECAHNAWIVDPEFRTEIYRGNGSKGHLLDEEIFDLCDILLRGFGSVRRLPYTEEQYDSTNPLLDEVQKSTALERLGDWRNKWVFRRNLPKRDLRFAG